MSDRELPPPELLRKLLRYEPESGKLFWLPRSAETFKNLRAAKMWGTKFENQKAFTAVNWRGYHYGTLQYGTYTAHRVIWAMQTGAWPVAHVDHINQDRLDNRWVNLREASHAENMRNTRSRKGSSSQYLGVSWDAKSLCWRARIQFDKRQINLGMFACEKQAAQAYDAKAAALFGDFASLNFPSIDNSREAQQS
jgi:hypothetical protein